MSTLVGDELMVSVLAQFTPGSTFRVGDESEIVNAFFQARQTKNFDPLFENYPFDQDGVEPRCRELSEALGALQQARLLTRWNPDLVDYKISPAVKMSFDRFIEPKVADGKPLVSELAAEIKSRLHVADPA